MKRPAPSDELPTPTHFLTGTLLLDCLGRFGHLARRSSARDDHGVFWRRPEPAFTDDDVETMFRTLWDIRDNTLLILGILPREEDDEDDL
jgi:hypothetical protein